MVAHTYAQPSDVYRESGIGALAFVTRPRPIDTRAGDSLDPITGTFSLIGHPYETGDLLRLVVNGSGYVPIGATAGQPYYAIRLDSWRFQIAATSGGSPLTFSDAGSGAWGIQRDPDAWVLAMARSKTSIVDQCLIAHATPLKIDPATGTYPEIVIGVVARMTARACLSALLGENASVRAPSLFALAAFDGDTSPPAQKGSLLGDWKDGQPIYPNPIDQNTVPDDAAYGMGRDAIGWAGRVM